jgi:hypothetical protein
VKSSHPGSSSKLRHWCLHYLNVLTNSIGIVVSVISGVSVNRCRLGCAHTLVIKLAVKKIRKSMIMEWCTTTYHPTVPPGKTKFPEDCGRKCTHYLGWFHSFLKNLCESSKAVLPFQFTHIWCQLHSLVPFVDKLSFTDTSIFSLFPVPWLCWEKKHMLIISAICAPVIGHHQEYLKALKKKGKGKSPIRCSW